MARIFTLFMFCLLSHTSIAQTIFTDTVFGSGDYWSNHPNWTYWESNGVYTDDTILSNWINCPDNFKYTLYIHALEDETNLIVDGSPAMHYIEWYNNIAMEYTFLGFNYWAINALNGGFNPNGSDSGYVAVENICLPDGIYYPEITSWPSSSYYTLINHYGDTVAFGNHEIESINQFFDMDTIVLGIQGCTEPTAQNFDPNATFSLQNNNQPYDCLGCNYNFSINYDSLLGCCPTEIYTSNGIEYNDYTLDTIHFCPYAPGSIQTSLTNPESLGSCNYPTEPNLPNAELVKVTIYNGGDYQQGCYYESWMGGLPWEELQSQGSYSSVDGAGEMSIPIGVGQYKHFEQYWPHGFWVLDLYDWHPSSYFLMLDSNNDTLLFASDTSSNGYSVHSYTIGTVGCTDTLAFNYNPLATVHYQDSCQYLGCTDINAINYDASATLNDSSCFYDLNSVVWNQKGSEITGTPSENYDYFGHVTDINYDGSIIAASAYFNDDFIDQCGHVRVFEYDGASWIQLGQTITGTTYDQNLGMCLSLDSTGHRLAISSKTALGIVDIYDLVSGVWTQIGQIHVVNGFGRSISLNHDGNRIVISSPYENGNNYMSGLTRVYEYNGSDWNQLGSNISGEGSNDLAGHDNSSVDINASGNIVAIGSQYNDNPNGSGAGNVMVFEYNGTNWSQKGQNIDGISNNDKFGHSVSINNSGNRLISGSVSCNDNGNNSGQARVFEFDETNNQWVQIGQNLNGDHPDDFFGTHVSMNGLGDIVSIGADQAQPPSGGYYDDNGQVKIFKYMNGNWAQIGMSLYGSNQQDYFGQYNQLDDLGHTIIIGSENFDLNTFLDAGKIEVFSIKGCTDPLALNYNPGATFDDGTCCYDCGVIEGFVFNDIDSNAVYDENIENPLGNQILQLQRSDGQLSYLTTNFDGYYSFIVDTGNQILSFYPPANWQTTSNQLNYNINVVSMDTLTDLDFGVMPDQTKGDMTIDITSGQTVCSSNSTINLNIKNLGTETITDVNVELWVNPQSQILGASDNGSIIGNYISWYLPGDFYPFVYTGQQTDISATIMIPNFQFMGNTIIDSARVTPIQTNLVEINAANNFDDHSRTVMCSYDPNDKLLDPLDCFNQPLDTIDYTIRFQNTGNFPATTVVLVDTLDLEKLDINTFQVLGASHAYSWVITPPAVLEVVFDNIGLVDSSVSFTDSQGYFKYSLAIRDSLTNLDPTSSSAHIFFDNNPAVVTNKPEVRFEPYLIASLQTSGNICFGQEDGEASLNITLAQPPYSIVWNNGETTNTIDSLSAGTYSVTLLDSNLCSYNDSIEIIELPEVITQVQSLNIQNLSSNVITIEWNEIPQAHNYQYQYRILGAGSWNSQFGSPASVGPAGNPDTTLDLSNLQSGTTYEFRIKPFFLSSTECVSTIQWNEIQFTTCQNLSSNIDVISCDNYEWNGQTYTSSGVYTFNTVNDLGCDSVAVLNLTINHSDTSITNVTACDTYTWNDSIYTQSGNYTNLYTDVNGCDSIHILNLTITNSSVSNTDVTACDSYDWDGVTYTQSGNYTNLYTDKNGCDSIHILNLTITNSSVSNTDITACDSYDWDGVIYTQSGSYTNLYSDVNGCDSIHILNLTITNSSVSNTDITACDSHDWDGVTYTQSGSYTNSYTDVNGCDSIQILNLTITNSSVSNTDITACDSYDWDGVTYTQSGSYTNIYTDANGCDSIHILNLTITNSSVSNTDVTACDTYDWDGVTYTQSGSYTNLYTDVNGCDSVHILNLTIINSFSTTNTLNICDGEVYTQGTSTYSSSGVYTDTFMSNNGCDSVIITELTVDDDLIAIINNVGNNLEAELISGGVTPLSYNWSTGENNQTITPTINGNYWVIIQDDNDCISDTLFFIVDWFSTSINEINNVNINIYPNPTTGELNIEFDNLKINQISITNTTGELIFNLNEIKTNKIKIDLNDKAKGVYLLKISTDHQIISRKIIIN